MQHFSQGFISGGKNQHVTSNSMAEKSNSITDKAWKKKSLLLIAVTTHTGRKQLMHSS